MTTHKLAIALRDLAADEREDIRTVNRDEIAAMLEEASDRLLSYEADQQGIGHLWALAEAKATDPDYLWVLWVSGRHYAVHGFLSDRRLVQWLQQEAVAGRLPERIRLK